MKRDKEVIIIRLTTDEKMKLVAYSNSTGATQSEIVRNYINQLNIKK